MGRHSAGPGSQAGSVVAATVKADAAGVDAVELAARVAAAEEIIRTLAEGCPGDAADLIAAYEETYAVRFDAGAG